MLVCDAAVLGGSLPFEVPDLGRKEPQVVGGEREVRIAPELVGGAGLEGLDPCELVGVGVDEVGQAVQHGDPLGHRHVPPPPVAKRGTGRGDGQVDVRLGAGGNSPDDVAGRGVADLQPRPARRRDGVPVDEHQAILGDLDGHEGVLSPWVAAAARVVGRVYRSDGVAPTGRPPGGRAPTPGPRGRGAAPSKGRAIEAPRAHRGNRLRSEPHTRGAARRMSGMNRPVRTTVAIAIASAVSAATLLAACSGTPNAGTPEPSAAIGPSGSAGASSSLPASSGSPAPSTEPSASSATPSPSPAPSPTVARFWDAALSGLASVGHLRLTVIGPNPGVLRYQPTASATVADGVVVFICTGGAAFDGQGGSFTAVPGSWDCGGRALVGGFRHTGQPVDAWSASDATGVSDSKIVEKVTTESDGRWRWSNTCWSAAPT